MTKLGLNCGGDFSEIADKPDLHRCIELADLLSQKFIDGEFDRIEMIYHHFKSAGSQILTQKLSYQLISKRNWILMMSEI